MTQVTGTQSSYDVNGNREDLSDIIFDVSPSDTPILSAIKKTTATATKHEWQTDALEAAVATNAAIEGDEASFTTPTATTKLDNYTQILTKNAIISGTQAKGVTHAGIKDMMAYKMERKMKEIKKDAEKSMFGTTHIGNAKVAGNDTTAREMGSLETYLVTNVHFEAGGAVSAGTGADVMTAGTTPVAFTEANLTAQLESAFDEGGDPSMLCVSATNQGIVSGSFAGNATRFANTNEASLNTSIKVYEGDFHTLKVVPCRQLAGRNVYAIDTNYLACADLRPAFSEDLAKTGDAYKKQIIWETTLEVCNEKAHVLVADTTG